jgi:hypothetical protein
MSCSACSEVSGSPKRGGGGAPPSVLGVSLDGPKNFLGSSSSPSMLTNAFWDEQLEHE